MPNPRLPLLARIGGAAAGAMSRAVSGEVARALPDSKNGETPKSLQQAGAQLATLFTTELGRSINFYSTDQWVRVKLNLQTAGPVAIGNSTEITPVLSGKGRLLTTNVPFEITIPKGTRLYYAAEAVNRIDFDVEPIPWMEQISAEITRVSGNIILQVGKLIAAITGKPAPETRMGPVGSNPVDRLTPMSRRERM